MRCLVEGAAVATEVALAQVIGEEHDNVGTLGVRPLGVRPFGVSPFGAARTLCCRLRSERDEYDQCANDDVAIHSRSPAQRFRPAHCMGWSPR